MAGSVEADTAATVRGDFSGLDATFDFTVLNALALAQVKGSYAGLIGSNLSDFGTSGLLRIALLSSGAYTATVVLGKSHFVVRGKFDANGVDHRVVKLPDGRLISIDLSLDLEGGDQVTGMLSDGGTVSEFAADRALYNAQSAVPLEFQGRFTLLARHDGADALAPQGDSFARLTILPKGSVRVTGKLADGTPFSQSTFLSKHETWPLYISLYRGKGAALGLVRHDANPASDLSASLFWTRPSLPKSPRFGAGFGTTLQLIGAHYTPPARGVRALSFPPTSNDGMISLEDGGLTEIDTALFTLSAKNAIVFSPRTR